MVAVGAGQSGGVAGCRMQPPISVYGSAGRYASALFSAASKAKGLEKTQKELSEVPPPPPSLLPPLPDSPDAKQAWCEKWSDKSKVASPVAVQAGLAVLTGPPDHEPCQQ